MLKGRLAPDPAVEVLYPGVDLQRYGVEFAELESVPAAQEREPIFLVAGRMVWQKKLELAIDAMRIALAMGMKGRLVIAGAVDEKSREYVNGLRARAEGLPITFEEGPSDERLIELYQEATALLFTAPNEDWGIVPLEAMASGTPVIAVASGGPCESVVHGETGWLLRRAAEGLRRPDARRVRDAGGDRPDAQCLPAPRRPLRLGPVRRPHRRRDGGGRDDGSRHASRPTASSRTARSSPSWRGWNRGSARSPPPLR